MNGGKIIAVSRRNTLKLLFLKSRSSKIAKKYLFLRNEMHYRQTTTKKLLAFTQRDRLLNHFVYGTPVHPETLAGICQYKKFLFRRSHARATKRYIFMISVKNFSAGHVRHVNIDSY